jgi:hypothetical protein
MGTDLSAGVRNDVASCIEKRRGEAAILRVTGCELASELFFPSRRMLRGDGGRHSDDVQGEHARRGCAHLSRSRLMLLLKTHTSIAHQVLIIKVGRPGKQGGLRMAINIH